MTLKVRHALLEIAKDANTRKSAVLIDDEMVIASGCSLQSILRPIDVEDANSCPPSSVMERLQRSELIAVHGSDTDEGRYLDSLGYEVTFDRTKLPSGQRVFQRRAATLLYIFTCPALQSSLHALIGESQTDESYTDVLLGSFLVLSLDGGTQDARHPLGRFLRRAGGHLVQCSRPVRVLDDVLVMCTPFGIDDFFKTISIGKVSNVMGPRSSGATAAATAAATFLISNALPPGCEGAAVFNSRLHLVGLIMCTSFRRDGEDVPLTMVASIDRLLRQFMRQLNVHPPAVCPTTRTPDASPPWRRCMVAVKVAPNSQGSGILLMVKDKRFVLTCSHVVFHAEASSPVLCLSAMGTFEADIVWRHPHHGRPFDVAVLSAPDHLPADLFVRISTKKPAVGQVIYNVGFVHDVDFSDGHNPSIFDGRIIKCTRHLINSDGRVVAGQSGGPMLDDSGRVVGVCVSNIRADGIIYPNINAAVPIRAIRHALEQYALTGDVGVLNDLIGDEAVQRAWTVDASPSIRSKL